MSGSILNALSITSFRNIKSAYLEFSPGINLIQGVNASGKSSLIEALHLLFVGRSFRAVASQQHLLQRGAHQFRLQARVTSISGQESLSEIHKLELGRSSAGIRRLLLDDSEVPGSRFLAEIMPSICFSQEDNNLIDDAPERRRRLLDWMVFHVEHKYLDDWSKFQKVLRQRNTFLKTDKRFNQKDFEFWSQEFTRAAGQVEQKRQEIFKAFESFFQDISKNMTAYNNLAVEFYSGWSKGVDLLDALASISKNEVQRRFTLLGPQKADLIFTFEADQVKYYCSRGEKKFLSIVFIMAQILFLRQYAQKNVLLLIDDWTAELDTQYQKHLLNLIHEFKIQAVITANDFQLEDILPDESKMFHVEQGSFLSN